MVARTRAEIEQIWSHVDSIKKLTDRVIGIGPLSIGLDTMVSWIPGINVIFSAGVGGYLVIQALRVKASAGTLFRMVSYLTADTAADAVPLAGQAVSMLFPAHLMAANALQKDIESTHWVEMRRADARASGAHEHHWAQARANGLRRVVYLHD